MKPPIHKAGYLHVEGGRILLCRKRHTTSLLIVPGGRIDPGETEQECVVRELREELGEVTVSGLSKVGSYTDQAAGEDCIVHVELYSGTLSGTPRAQAEIKELVWFGPEDNPSLLSPSLRNRIIPDLLSRGFLKWNSPHWHSAA